MHRPVRLSFSKNMFKIIVDFVFQTEQGLHVCSCRVSHRPSDPFEFDLWKHPIKVV